jgi:hypothetical protein
MARGYGYPLFVFQGVLSSQIAALLHLGGLPWVPSMNGAYLVGLVGSGLTCYLLARELWGEFGGWGAAAAFLFVPYHLYVVYYRSSLSETVAWIFPPLVLWGMTRYARGELVGLWAGAGAMAALAMTHAVSLYLFFPLFLAWALAEVLGRRSPDDAGAAGPSGRAAVRMVILLLMGGGLGLFAWGPGVMERAFVQLGRATSAWVFDYRANFLPWRQLLALPRAADPRLINDWPARGVGLLFLLTALAGLAAFWLGRPRRLEKARVLGVTLGLVASLFLVTGLSRPLWDAVPLLAGFQFPWRWLAPVTLSVALLTGGAFRWLAERHHLLALGAMALLVAAHWGWLYPPRGGLPTPTTPSGMVAWELATDTVGTTASNELLPIWAQMPSRDNSVTRAVLEDKEPDRLDRTSLPAGAELIASEMRLLGATYRLRSPRDFIARFRAFYYPGWRITANGVPVTASPDPDTGWVSFPVPDGEVLIDIRFGEASRRAWLDALSIVSLLTLTGLSLWPARSRRWAAPTGAAGVLRPGAAQKMMVAAAFLLLLKVGLADRLPLLWRQSKLRDDGALRRVSVPLDADFEGYARLLGVDGLPTTMTPENPPVVRLYWRALRPGDADWHVGLTLIGPDGSRWQTVLRPYRWSRTPPPMWLWSPDRYARMDYEIHVPAGMPPGTYEMALSLFDRATAEPASLLDASSNPVGPALSLGQVLVQPPASPASLAALGVPGDAMLQTCGDFGLWTAEVDRDAAAPGDVVHLRMVWEALAPSSGTTEGGGTDLAVTLMLTDEAGETLHTWGFPFSAPWWPTGLWTEGQRWVGRGSARLPGGLTTGTYRLVLRAPSCGRLMTLPLSVTAPERRWSLPEDFTELDASSVPSLGGKARLAGFKLVPDRVLSGETADLFLAWEALAEMTTAYRVFVHVVDDAGNLLAQHDGEPVMWTRPTTGWTPGEIVVDPRPLEIPDTAPPGTYRVRVGLYDPAGDRLMTADGDDALDLPMLQIGD